jgi:hypothetical protein
MDDEVVLLRAGLDVEFALPAFLLEERFEQSFQRMPSRLWRQSRAALQILELCNACLLHRSLRFTVRIVFEQRVAGRGDLVAGLFV